MPFSMSAWATDSSTLQPPYTTPGGTVLWKAGVLNGVYIPQGHAAVSYGVADECPNGLTPSYNVALVQGFIASSDSSDDPGIRGTHLKVKSISTSNHQIYLSLSEAYVDTVGEADKPIDVSYWIYCGQ